MKAMLPVQDEMASRVKKETITMIREARGGQGEVARSRAVDTRSIPTKRARAMAATLIDSTIFGNIFSTDAMRRVWSDENRTAKLPRRSRRALALVQGRLGIIPQEAADEIVRNCDIGKIDMEKLRAATERIGYPVLGVVSQLNALCRDKLGEYCHWGATTQDITDTAHRAADPRRPRARRGRSRRDLRRRSRNSRAATATRRSSGAAICSRRSR